MNASLTILRQLVIMFLYMGIGWLLVKRGLISKEGSRDLSNVLIYAVNPAVIIDSFTVAASPERDRALLISFLGALLLLVAAVAVSRLAFRKEPVLSFGSTFSNSGLGIPLVSGSFGPEGVMYATGNMALLSVFQWTYGNALLTGEKSRIKFRPMLVNPVVIPFLAGLCIYFLRIHLPPLLGTCLSAMAALNAPVANIVLGTYLGEIALMEIFTSKSLWVCSFFRLLVIPLLTMLGFFLFFQHYQEVVHVLLVICSAPVAMNTAVYSRRVGQDYRKAARLVCLSTLLSLVTMPLVMCCWTLAAGPC